MKNKHLNKRHVVVVVALIILGVFILPGISQGSEGFLLSASEEKNLSGNEVTVTIRADNAAGSEGGQFVLNFDPDLVKPVSAEAGEMVIKASSGLHMANLDYERGQLMFMWVTAAADTPDSGEIGVITFELLQEGDTALDFGELIVAPESLKPAVPVAGKITVAGGGVDGDSNGNQEDEEITDRDDDHGDEQDDEDIDNDALQEDETETDNDSEDEAALDVGSEAERGSNTLLIVLIVVVVLISAGFVVFKRSRKKVA